jgi:hypothetical protein
MLVIQMSVVMSEDGEIEHPADVLDEMRERFLMHGTRSLFNWVLRLRAYSKRIRNCTTSLPPSDRHDTGLICAQFGIVHDCDPESPRFSLILESTPFYDLFWFSSTLHGRVCTVTLHL